MSEQARRLFEGMRNQEGAGRPGPTAMERFAAEIGGEMKRLGTQGAMELASALFNGQSFVPYGPGQYTPSVDHRQEQGLQMQQERDLGRDR